MVSSRWLPTSTETWFRIAGLSLPQTTLPRRFLVQGLLIFLIWTLVLQWVGLVVCVLFLLPDSCLFQHPVRNQCPWGLCSSYVSPPTPITSISCLLGLSHILTKHHRLNQSPPHFKPFPYPSRSLTIWRMTKVPWCLNCSISLSYSISTLHSVSPILYLIAQNISNSKITSLGILFSLYNLVPFQCAC